MRVHSLRRTQTVRRPLGEVFSFFQNPENLSLITPENLGFKILTPRPVRMKEGAVIDYTISLGGIPVRWTSLISEFDPPRHFVDIQLRGPYLFWHHKHTFTAIAEGTVINDDVLYALPFGIAGEITHYLAVRRKLEAIFQLRSRVIANLFAERVSA
jgi:ligand-binding SRPBCC domain-containing protein